MDYRKLISIAGLVCAVCGLLLFLINRFPDTLKDRDTQIQLVSLVLILSYFLFSLLGSRTYKLTMIGTYIVAWVGIGFVIFAGFSFRYDLQEFGKRLFANTIPAFGLENADGSVSFPKSANGHYFVEARVEGVPIRFMVDTGATHVVLTIEDAHRLGVNLEELNYNQLTDTAGGNIMTAPLTLLRMRVGSIEINKVQASVSSKHLKQSLLGLSFLERLKEYKFSQDFLTLKN